MVFEAEINFSFKKKEIIELNSLHRSHSPEDVLSDDREPWDILVVDNVCVQGGLCHQVGPCQRWVHQGVTWEIQRNTVFTYC